MIRQMRAASVAVAVGVSGVMLTGCSTLFYLPSDQVEEDVVVTTDAELRDEMTVSMDACDDVSMSGTLVNNSTSAASVDVTIQLDDGVAPGSASATVEVEPSSSEVFTLDNTTGVMPLLGCYATIDAVRIK